MLPESPQHPEDVLLETGCGWESSARFEERAAMARVREILRRPEDAARRRQAAADVRCCPGSRERDPQLEGVRTAC